MPAALPTSGAIIVRTYGNTSTELELRIEIDRESIFAFIHSFVISLFLCNSLLGGFDFWKLHGIHGTTTARAMVHGSDLTVEIIRRVC